MTVAEAVAEVPHAEDPAAGILAGAEPVQVIAADSPAEAAVAIASPEPLPDDVPLIEVWRPQRFVRHQPNRAARNAEPGARQQHPRSVRAAAVLGDAAEAALLEGGASAPPDQNRRRPPKERPPGGRRYEGDKPRPGFARPAAGSVAPADGQALASEAAVADAGPVDAKPAEAKPAEAKPRFDNRPRPQRDRPGSERPVGDRPRPDGGRSSRQDAPRQDSPRPDSSRPDRPRRDGPRPDEQRNAPRGTFASTEKPASRERQPDPDSPFAKLLALKAQLESKSRKE